MNWSSSLSYTAVMDYFGATPSLKLMSTKSAFYATHEQIVTLHDGKDPYRDFYYRVKSFLFNQKHHVSLKDMSRSEVLGQVSCYCRTTVET